jgi:hypothetical protein
VLVQCLFDPDPVARLPAHHGADGSLEFRRDGVPREGCKEGLRDNGIIGVTQCILQFRQTSYIVFGFCMVAVESVKNSLA